MNRLIVGNWKHNPVTLAEALLLAKGVAAAGAPEGTTVVVCPPLPYISNIRALYPGLTLGVQDLSDKPQGAYTGEVGADILKNLRVQYAIIGHSERRALGETDEQVTAKVTAARAKGITPVVCVGEPRSVRDQGIDAIHAFLMRQLDAIPGGGGVIVAYEPIWASGKDTADNPADAESMAQWIAGYLMPRIAAVSVLYGGAVTPENVSLLAAQEHIAGFLVGHESLDVAHFSAIVHAR